MGHLQFHSYAVLHEFCSESFQTLSMCFTSVIYRLHGEPVSGENFRFLPSIHFLLVIEIILTRREFQLSVSSVTTC